MVLTPNVSLFKCDLAGSLDTPGSAREMIGGTLTEELSKHLWGSVSKARSDLS